MADVVAMASVIEDFETQPCKKSRKSVDTPAVKTITNYFSPVPKSMEKPFSPPRSNNIMDYFNRKTPPEREKDATTEQSKENQKGNESHQVVSGTEKTVKQPGKLPKKRGRPCKAARRLQEKETEGSTEECVIVETLGDDGSSREMTVSGSGILGSDTAALLAQVCADACVDEDTIVKKQSGTVSAQQGHKEEPDQKDSTSTKKKSGKSADGAVAKGPPIDKVERTQPSGIRARKGKAKQEQEQHDGEECVPEVEEAEQSLCDVSMEVNMDEASQLNSSTITISFEDFLQSQDREEDKGDKKDGMEDEESKDSVESREKEGDVADVPKPAGVEGPQVSPRTLTFQAEVHAISLNHEPARAVEKKVASIFTRRKGEGSPVEVRPSSSLHPQPRPELLPVPKRKSNVVLQEEDLELAMVESDSTPKCSQAERKQFMSAFKQPSQEGAKPKLGKGQGKQKQPADKVPEEAGDEGADRDISSVPAVEQPSAGDKEEKEMKKKPGRKGRKKVQNKKSSPSPATQEEPDPKETGTQEAEEEPAVVPTTSTPATTPAVKRPRRKIPPRPVCVAKEAGTLNPARKTKSRKKGNDAGVPPNGPGHMSTPRSRHRVFLAQMVSPPDEKESPIRMKFTRVFSTPEAVSDFEILSPPANKGSNASKKRKQAKKLVEKAKAIQKNKKDTSEDRGSLRRSSRSHTSTSRIFCENEESVVCLEDEQSDSAQTKRKSQKRLRSLNEVLGKPAAKNPAASLLVLGKKPQRTSAGISIFDESSHEGSENSQDDEQLRARREFLKSGLPESFKRQIARTVASQEAYSLSCSSFQPTVHVLQTTQDCSLWTLPWPVTPLLQCLKDVKILSSNPLPCVQSSPFSKTVPVSRVHAKKGSGWREEISQKARQLLAEEISASNPPFPAHRFLTHFLKRRADHLQPCATSEVTLGPKALGAPASVEAVGGKRKRVDEGVVKVTKKQRSNRSEGEEKGTGAAPTPEPQPPRRRGRTRGADRQNPSIETTPLPPSGDIMVVLDDSPVSEEAGKQDSMKEDVLWTEKYQPQHSSDVIGNTGSVRRLHSWLKEWKLRTDREERKERKKQKEGNSNDSWDCGEDDSQEGEELTCNTLLISGPTGVGKTAAVYACAQELGFKVFEVNASSQRSGRQILSQLKEATQSHQVDIQGVNTHKPTYFNSCSARLGYSPRKVNTPRRVVSSPRKVPQSPRGPKRGGLAPTSLASFFKMGRPPSKEPANPDKTQPTVAPNKAPKAKETAAKTKEPPTPPAGSATEPPSEENSKKTATSLILFEEVDVILDDDSGFLAAIKTFMATTKRPVILTTSDPSFSTTFDGFFEEIHFNTPSVVNVGSYLQLLCLAENTRTDPRDVSTMLSLNSCDIRQSLLHLQYWTRSSGGRPAPCSQTKAEVEVEGAADGGVCEEVTLPPCDTGCTQQMLGLLNVEPDRDVLDMLTSQNTAEPGCLEVLRASRRRGLDLLYSNLEAILPLPVTHLTITAPRNPQALSKILDMPFTESLETASPAPQPDSLPPVGLPQVAEGSDDGSPVKCSSAMKRRKKSQHCPEDQDPFHSDSDSDNAFLSLREPHHAPQTSREPKDASTDVQEESGGDTAAPVRMRRVPLTPEQRMKSEPVSRCLSSLAEFLDHMSFLDSSLLHPTARPGGARGSLTFGLSTRAEVKDGMTDEPREECDRGSWAEEERRLEIQAMVEALSFQRCRRGVEVGWTRAQALGGELGEEAVKELSLPVAPHRQGFSLTLDLPCDAKVLQARRGVMDTFLSARVNGTLGNRRAVALDYLPTLRAICKTETLKEQGKTKRRFLHYLESIHLGLPKNTLQHLAEGFP
ncbi:ATPase family AAA domain-containing protein 5 [Osmerus eperlanus]|uniref:ATPase family AAA domain-containing protein 5 n=1 Tax=Osmerus eperlanus TaxID=29151 RepID=UPI002E0EB2C9